MDPFLIETPHREQDCLNLVQLLHAQGHLTHFDWGFMNGLHTSWAVIEADNEVEARLAVPPFVRGQYDPKNFFRVNQNIRPSK
jgi:Berberine and berberine like